jgi:hypothetical protein
VKARRYLIRLFAVPCIPLTTSIDRLVLASLIAHEIRVVHPHSPNIHVYLMRLISWIGTANKVSRFTAKVRVATATSRTDGQGRALGDTIDSPVNFDRRTLTQDPPTALVLEGAKYPISPSLRCNVTGQWETTTSPMRSSRRISPR